MKYDSWDDYFYFVLGASIAAGRVFWVGSDGDSNKTLIRNEDVSVYLSSDNKIATLKKKVMSCE